MDLDIPAGESNVRHDGYHHFGGNVKITGFQPHLHNLGKRQCIEAILPDNSVEMLNCADWDFGWHIVYNYRDDVAPLLPAGTTLHVVSWHDKDLVWTVTHNGRTDKAYASLWPVWELDQSLIGRNRGLTSRVQPGVLEGNLPPSLTVDGAGARSVTLPGSVQLAVLVADDGIPPPNPDLATVKSSIGSGDIDASAVDFRAAAPTGLAVTWLHWRGPGSVAFDPRVPGIVDGRAVTTASFSEPGTYVLRAVADDMVLTTPVDVTVTVSRATSTRRP